MSEVISWKNITIRIRGKEIEAESITYRDVGRSPDTMDSETKALSSSYSATFDMRSTMTTRQWAKMFMSAGSKYRNHYLSRHRRKRVRKRYLRRLVDAQERLGMRRQGHHRWIYHEVLIRCSGYMVEDGTVILEGMEYL